MRDVLPAGGGSNRRTFINNVDDNLSNNNSSNDDNYYESLKQQFCPGCRTALFYNTQHNHLVCSSCGLVEDLNEKEVTKEEDYGGATTSHSNQRKAIFPDENETTTPAIVPMSQRRTGILKKPEWSQDQDIGRLANKGAKIISYSEITPDTKDMLNPGSPDTYFSDRDREQRVSQGNVLNTKFDAEGQTRTRIVNKK